MSAVEGLGLVIFVGLAAYTVLGGADFGAGLWDLSRDRAQRDLVARAMAPVWEANHVWLIFVVITLFTGFPGAFGALSRALVAPVSIALLGIVLRGAAFVFRQYGAPDGGAPVRGTALWGRVFAVSSLVTPFAFGTAAGALAGGTLRADGSAGLWQPYLTPLPLLAGLLAVVCCAYLAAVYLSRDAERIDSPALVSRFRRRALTTGVLAGALALAALPLLRSVANCAGWACRRCWCPRAAGCSAWCCSGAGGTGSPGSRRRARRSGCSPGGGWASTRGCCPARCCWPSRRRPR
jgi:cytochrome d ubiquinol oxidase subunit II